jgi:membrane-bound serine protease (ClpP class)
VILGYSNSLVVDANVIYLVLVFGLWAAVTASYIPGTGVAEVIALIALGISLVLLFGLPTNWTAVLLIAIGVLAFLLIPFVNARLARAAQAGLVLQVIGGLFLFTGEVRVSWLIIGLTVGASLLYHHYALMPLLRRARQSAAVRDDNAELIGADGRVVKPFMPVGKRYVGTVHVRGEQWTAAADHALDSGDEVVVLERDGLQLYVESLKHKHTPQPEEVS